MDRVCYCTILFNARHLNDLIQVPLWILTFLVCKRVNIYWHTLRYLQIHLLVNILMSMLLNRSHLLQICMLVLCVLLNKQTQSKHSVIIAISVPGSTVSTEDLLFFPTSTILLIFNENLLFIEIYYRINTNFLNFTFYTYSFGFGRPRGRLQSLGIHCVVDLSHDSSDKRQPCLAQSHFTYTLVGPHLRLLFWSADHCF